MTPTEAKARLAKIVRDHDQPSAALLDKLATALLAASDEGAKEQAKEIARLNGVVASAINDWEDYERICNELKERAEKAEAQATEQAGMVAALLACLKRAHDDSGCDGDLCAHSWHEMARALIENTSSAAEAFIAKVKDEATRAEREAVCELIDGFVHGMLGNGARLALISSIRARGDATPKEEK